MMGMIGRYTWFCCARISRVLVIIISHTSYRFRFGSFRLVQSTVRVSRILGILPA